MYRFAIIRFCDNLTLTRAFGLWLSYRFPVRDSRVFKDSMRHIWPAFVEESRVDRFGLVRSEYLLSIWSMNMGFFRCEKSRAGPSACCAEREYRSNSASICDTTSGDNRCVRNGINDTRYQRECGDFTLHVPTYFPSLCNENIYTGLNSVPRLFGTPYRLKNSAVVRVDLLDVRLGVPE